MYILVISRQCKEAFIGFSYQELNDNVSFLKQQHTCVCVQLASSAQTACEFNSWEKYLYICPTSYILQHNLKPHTCRSLIEYDLYCLYCTVYAYIACTDCCTVMCVYMLCYLVNEEYSNESGDKVNGAHNGS